MKKLRLEIDELEIESFETLDKDTDTPGTVDAMQTPTANSGGSCFESSCRPVMCRTDDTCPALSCEENCGY